MADDNKDKKASPGQKVGVYVCHCGGNISDHVAVDQVCKNAEKIPGVIKVQDNAFMCSDPGQDLIMEDIKNGVVDLKTGQLLKFAPRFSSKGRAKLRNLHLLSQLKVAYKPGPPPAKWIEFLREALAYDGDVMDVVQRACGYSLTGETGEHMLLDVISAHHRDLANRADHGFIGNV